MKLNFAHLIGAGRKPTATASQDPDPKAADVTAAEDSEDEAEEDDTSDDETDDDEETEDDDNDSEANAAVIVQLCAAAKLSTEIAAAFIAAKTSLDDVKKRIEAAPKIRAAVAAAGKFNAAIEPDIADNFIISGTSIKGVRAALFDKLVALQSPEIRNTHTPGNRPAGVRHDYGWGNAVAKRNGEAKGN